MKLMIRIALSVCIAALSAAPASAGWLYPFGGWWGAGYYGSPAYSAPMYGSNYAPSYTSYYGSPSYASYYGSPSYASSYGSFSSPSYGCCGNSAPVYAASYGSYGGGCCDNSCCQSSCGNSCGSGCASNSCVGTTPTGSLKPAQDPISDRKTPAYDEDNRLRNFEPRSTPPRTDDRLDPINERDRLDPFVRPGTENTRPNPGTGDTRPNPGTGTGTDRNPGGMFDGGIDRERTNQKPPMDDPLNGEELDPIKPELGNPVDEKTFFEDASQPDNTTSRIPNAVIARTSSLSEVITPKRLASRSLPASHQPVSRSTLADKSNNPKSDSSRPIRWISAPIADGHVQL